MAHTTYKGIAVHLFGRTSKHLEERLEGESWIAMRRRTESQRMQLEKEDQANMAELIQIIKQAEQEQPK